MTPITALELPFADGSYLFDLKLPQLAELQEKRGCGVFRVYGRIMRGRYIINGEPMAVTGDAEAFAEDIFETIRLGLIGGGRGLVDGKEVEVSSITARRLVENYAHPAPLRESWTIAAAILGARIEGYIDPKVEPAQEPASEPKKKPTKSTRRRSSPTAQSSGATGES